MERCLELAKDARQPYDEAVCSWVEASLLREEDPARSRAAELRALEATTRANSPRTEAYSAGRHMRLSWTTKTRVDAIRDSLAAIDSLEALRGLQDEPDASAELFSAWTLDYYWFSGRLLQQPEQGDVELAFSITERMRARTLLDTLARGRPPLDATSPSVADHRALLVEIAAVQRKLMDPRLDPAERRAQLEALDQLERREQDAQLLVAAAFPGGRRVRPSFAGIDDLELALDDTEAVLSFQVGISETYEGEFGGGSWLVVVTNRGRAVYRIPDRTELTSRMPVFTGLIERGDGLEGPAAVRLYQDLLGDALRDLPAGVERLILLPDGALHHLPFDALRPAPDAEPLAARYELVVAPSATLWLHWRKSPPPSTTRRALVFADPELGTSTEGDAPERNAVLAFGLQLGRLPYARRESRSLERHLGSVDVLLGEQASEGALKRRNLSDYRVLHFAAHAIADDARPERSAVVLSAGADTEDGLLQAREIQGLDLDGRIVVLSACQTATGAVLSGEGVLSLARAFFEAGSAAVIGSRWPIRDDDAAAFFDSFYERLGRGATLAAALAQAKRDARAQGRPAAVWAGLVLIGNGDLAPFPEGSNTPANSSFPVYLGILIAVLAAAGALATRRLRSTLP